LYVSSGRASFNIGSILFFNHSNSQRLNSCFLLSQARLFIDSNVSVVYSVNEPVVSCHISACIASTINSCLKLLFTSIHAIVNNSKISIRVAHSGIFSLNFCILGTFSFAVIFFCTQYNQSVVILRLVSGEVYRHFHLAFCILSL